jgi:phytoene synthase
VVETLAPNTRGVELERLALVPSDPTAVLAAGSKTFRFASFFLAPDRRTDAALLYRFCRHVDDVADESEDADAARAGLARLTDELTGRVPARPLIAETLALFRRRDIDVRYALELIVGVASDLDTVRVRDDAELVRYAYRVAGTVGLMMCGVLGVKDPDALAHAVDLGVGMQITNICRDVAEDARLGRVYLPATRLRSVGIPATPDGVATSREGVQVVVLDILSMADRYYTSGEDGLRYIPTRARLAILVAGRLYRAIGVVLRQRGGDALAGRTVVPFAGKVLFSMLALLSFPGLSRRRLSHRPALHQAIAGWPGADSRARSG